MVMSSQLVSKHMSDRELSFKALKRWSVELLSSLWEHLQYYRYDPSKPSKSAFLKLTPAEQEAWIEVAEPDFGERL